MDSHSVGVSILSFVWSLCCFGGPILAVLFIIAGFLKKD